MRVALLVESAEAPTSKATVVPLDSSTPVARELPRALGVPDEHDPATLVVEVSFHEVRRQEAAQDLDPEFEAAAERRERIVSGLLEDAAEQQGLELFDLAEKAYAGADASLGVDASPRRVALLVAWAEVVRAQGRPGEAAALLDRALAMDPEHVDALRARAEVAEESGEALAAAALRQRLVRKLETSAQRADVLRSIAEASLRAARDAIGEASELSPGNVYYLERLRAVNEAAGLWQEAVTAAVQIAELTTEPDRRARALVDAARLCSERTHNPARAAALYEAAIEDDPRAAGAFAALEAELVRAGDPAGLASAYERQIARLAALGDAEQEQGLLRKLVRVRVDELRIPRAAIATLERLIQLSPHELAPRLELAALFEEAGELALATRALEQAAHVEPSRVEVYRSLARLFRRTDDADRVYSACSVLVALGEADQDEQLAFAQHRPEALPTPRSALDEDSWSELLPEGHSRELDQIAAIIQPMVLDLWCSRVAPSVLPAPQERVAEDRTAAAADSFAWAARLLGLPQPEIYARPSEMRHWARLVPQPRLAFLLGRPVLAGRSSGELAFLAAHHLTYVRPGWRVTRVVGTRDDIRSLMLAAVAVACPDASAVSDLGPNEQEIAAQLWDRTGPADREAMGRAVEQLLSRDGNVDVAAWLRSIDETACRAGLLASGDVTAAAHVLAVSGASPGGHSAAQRVQALLPFCVSQRYSALRHYLGVHVG